MNKVIVIAAYNGYGVFKDTKYKHQQEIEYSKRKLNHITNYLMDKGLTTMIIPYPERIIVYVGEGRLSQR